MAEIRKVVKQVLSQLGASREARHYLGQFSGTDSMRFAVVKVEEPPAMNVYSRILTIRSRDGVEMRVLDTTVRRLPRTAP